MSMIGAISVKISGDSSGFTKAANQAQKDAAKTSKSLNQSIAQFAKWAAAAGAAYLSVKKVSEQFAILDNLGKTSDALGIVQQRLQALQHVASLTGTSADQMSVNLERMQRNLGRVAREGGPAEKALKDIGVNAKEIINLPADKQLERIAQSMGNVENSAVKASIAQDLFGRDGVRMLKMMEQLKENGLDPVVAELEAMGVALSRADTAKIEAANDALFKAGRASDAIFQQLAVKFAPIVEKAALAMVEFSKQTNNFGDTAGNVFNFAVRTVGLFADSIRGIHLIIKGLTAGFQGFAIAINTIFAGVSSAVDWLINGAIGNVNKLIAGLNNIPGVGLSAIDEFVNPATKLFKDGADAWSAALAGTLDEMHELAMRPLPSDQIEKFVRNVEAAADAAAQAVQDASGGQGGGFLGGLSDAEIAELDKRIEAIRQAGLNQSQILQERYEADLEALRLALENELLTRDEFNQYALESAQRHADALTEIDVRAAQERAQAQMDAERAIQSMRQNTLSLAVGLLDQFAGKSKAAAVAAVAINKGLAMAQAAQNTAVGVMKGFTVDPTGAMSARIATMGKIQMGLIAATGLMQAASAGRGGSANVFSGGMAAVNTTSGSGGQGGPSRNISISLTGSSFGAGGIRDLISEINAAVGDGVALRVTG